MHTLKQQVFDANMDLPPGAISSLSEPRRRGAYPLDARDGLGAGGPGYSRAGDDPRGLLLWRYSLHPGVKRAGSGGGL